MVAFLRISSGLDTVQADRASVVVGRRSRSAAPGADLRPRCVTPCSGSPVASIPPRAIEPLWCLTGGPLLLCGPPGGLGMSRWVNGLPGLCLSCGSPIFTHHEWITGPLWLPVSRYLPAVSMTFRRVERQWWIVGRCSGSAAPGAGGPAGGPGAWLCSGVRTCCPGRSLPGLYSLVSCCRSLAGCSCLSPDLQWS